MKTVINSAPQQTFGDVPVGACFVMGGSLYLRVAAYQDRIKGISCNAAQVVTGSLSWVTHDTVVTLVKELTAEA